MSTGKGPTIYAADLFCGAGGFTEGFLRACEQLGHQADMLAINHWEVAVSTHAENHRGVRHLCQSLETVDPRKVVPGGKLSLLLLAPECTHFSGARGGKPMNDQSRACPWRALEWVDALDIDCILLENVKEFPTWGPIHPCRCGAEAEARAAGEDPAKVKHKKGAKCYRPIESKKGLFFRRFVSNLRAYGYKVEWRVFCAADYGDATTRERFFLQARKDRKPIVWPEPTHRAPAQMEKLTSQSPLWTAEFREWRPAREIIRWDIKGHSIWMDPVEARKHNIKRPLCLNTLKRIFEGLRRFCGLEFVLPPEGFYRGNAPRAVDEPLPSVTASRGGGHLVEPYLLPHQHGSNGPENVRSVDRPLPTITGTSADMFLVPPYVILLRNNATVASIDEPLRTITAGGGHHGLAEAFLIPNFTERTGQTPRCHSVDAPLPTVTSHGAGGLVEPFVTAIDQQSGGPQVRSVADPLATFTTKARLALVQPHLLQFAHMNGGGPRVHSLDEPLRTLTGTREFALVDPYLLGQQSCAAPRSVQDPVPTIAGAGAISLIQPYVTQYHNGRDGHKRNQSVDEPLRTLDTSNRYGLAHPFLVKYYGTAGANSVDEPLDTITATDRFALVTPELQVIGEVLGRLEILFRMLRPEELAGAMSFNTRKTYVFLGNQEDQVRQIGNAVPCELARCLTYSALSGKSDVPVYSPTAISGGAA